MKSNNAYVRNASSFFGIRNDIDSLKENLKIGVEVEIVKGHIMGDRNTRKEMQFRRCRVIEKYENTVLLEYKAKHGTVRTCPSYTQLILMMRGEEGVSYG